MGNRFFVSVFAALVVVALGGSQFSCTEDGDRVRIQKGVDKLKRDLSRLHKAKDWTKIDAALDEVAASLGDNAEYHEQKIKSQWLRARIKGKTPKDTTYDEKFVAGSKAAMQAAIEKFPARLDFRFGLTTACRETGDFEGELAAFRSLCDYVKANPDLTFMAPVGDGSFQPFDGRLAVPEKISTAIEHYAGLQTEEGYEKMFKLASLSTEYFEHDFSGWNSQGAYHYVKGDLEKAVESFKKAHEIVPQHPLLMMNLGKLSADLGKKSEAKNYYEGVLQLKVDDNLKAAATAALAELK